MKISDPSIRLAFLLGVAFALILVYPVNSGAQETVHACYVPDVGAVYLTQARGLPSDCLSSSHVPISWTDGGDGTATDSPPAGSTDDLTQYLLTDGVRQATDGFAVTGEFNTGTIPAEGEGVRLIWYPGEAAFRAGRVDGDQWDAANVGDYSFAVGSSTTASGLVSTAMGNATTASGISSTAIGRQTTASGISSTAMGREATASGSNSTAMGYKSEAGGDQSTAMGQETTASGISSTAMGGKTTASGSRSTAMGGNSEASGRSSTAMGTLTTASGDQSTAMGQETTASGSSSTAMGHETTASGAYSTAMGDQTTASGAYSTAMGDSSEASGRSSTAMGLLTTASGDYSTAMGASSEASGLVSVAMGEHAAALHSNTFVFSAGWTPPSGKFASTRNAQFLINAWGVGIGTNSPRTQLDVSREVSGAASIDNHVVRFVNSASSGGDVLVLQSNASEPVNAGVNFITFRSRDGAIGSIEGDGSGGIRLNSGGGDFAERLPRLRKHEAIEAGDVVGIFGGLVSKTTAGADQLMVVTDRAVVLGNDPGPEARSDYEKIAFLGQVPLKVRGPVNLGDLLVASGRADGAARAVAPADYQPIVDGPVVGQAWEASAGGAGHVTALVGADGRAAALQSVVERQQARIEHQDARLESQRARLDRLETTIKRLVGEYGLTVETRTSGTNAAGTPETTGR